MPCHKKDYPRPQMVRGQWMNLNGRWDFSFDDKDEGLKNEWYLYFPKEKDILVPYTYETDKSGIGIEAPHAVVWYYRDFSVAYQELDEQRVLLHLEGCDYHTKVWINGIYAGEHEGGYARFSFDIRELLKEGKNNICVRAEDFMSETQMRGKQRWKDTNYGCWYVQSTGIWKTVWLESVPETYISGLKMTPLLDERKLDLELQVAGMAAECECECTVTYEGRLITRLITGITDRCTRITLDIYNKEVDEWGAALWSPENPALYDLDIRLAGKDNVSTYFGMREIRIRNGTVLLNGSPLYQRLILDQGYWGDSHLTPPDEMALVSDLEIIRELGYNGLRKHQKTEDERFLYWCDVKGLLVWEEAPSSYRYSDEGTEAFARQWMEIVRQNYNHPSVIVWTPVNESWGIPAVERCKMQQSFSQMMYHLTKCFDPMRPVIVNDGWEHTISDILTLHDYEEDGELLENKYQQFRNEILSNQLYHNNYKTPFADGFTYQGQPVLISEYGGIAFETGAESGWGYGRKVKDEEEFLKRYEALTMAIKRLPNVCGYCYTQLTDVQQEVNGLLDINRNYKAAPEKIREINLRQAGLFSINKGH